MSFTIQRAEPEDAAALIEYLQAVGGESGNLTFGAEGLPVTVEEETAFLEKNAASPRSIMLLAKEDGEIIGDGHIEAFSRRLSHRAGLGITVRKKAWGRGVGTALMERLIAHAREQELEIIELQVRSDNLRAIRLYEKFGFVKIGRYPGFMKVDGVNADCDLMNLYLRRDREKKAGMGLHDRIAEELDQTKSLAALIWLVERGRELEFSVEGKGYFLSRSKAEQYVSLWDSKTEQSFDTVEQLLENAAISGRPFLDAWKDAKIETIF